MNRYILTARKLIQDKEFTRRLYGATLAAALFILALVVRGPNQQGRILTDSSGNAVKISRHSMASTEQYDLTLTVGSGDETEKRDVTIDLRAVESGSSAGIITVGDADTKAAEIDAEIDRMLTEIEYSDEESVILPESLSDGTPVTWTARKQEDRSGIIIVPFLYLAIIAAAVKTGIDKQTDGENTARREIMKGLPRFCNQLFLMMNAGMILSDAFERICLSYAEYGEENMSV